MDTVRSLGELVGYVEYVSEQTLDYVSELIGYVEYTGDVAGAITSNIPTVGELVAYVEYHLDEGPNASYDSYHIGDTLGYVEFISDERAHVASELVGYVEYEKNDIALAASELVGYVEYTGDAAGAITSNIPTVGELVGYVEYHLDEGPNASYDSFLAGELIAYIEAEYEEAKGEALNLSPVPATADFDVIDYCFIYTPTPIDVSVDAPDARFARLVYAAEVLVMYEWIPALKLVGLVASAEFETSLALEITPDPATFSSEISEPLFSNIPAWVAGFEESAEGFVAEETPHATMAWSEENERVETEVSGTGIVETPKWIKETTWAELLNIPDSDIVEEIEYEVSDGVQAYDGTINQVILGPYELHDENGDFILELLPGRVVTLGAANVYRQSGVLQIPHEYQQADTVIQIWMKDTYDIAGSSVSSNKDGSKVNAKSKNGLKIDMKHELARARVDCVDPTFQGQEPPLEITPSPATASVSSQVEIVSTGIYLTPDYITASVDTVDPTFESIVPFEYTPDPATCEVSISAPVIYTPFEYIPFPIDIICDDLLQSIYTPLELTPTPIFCEVDVPNPTIFTPLELALSPIDLVVDTAEQIGYFPFIYTPSTVDITVDCISPDVSAPLVLYPYPATADMDVSCGIHYIPFEFTATSADCVTDIAVGVIQTPLYITPETVGIVLDSDIGDIYTPFEYTSDPANLYVDDVISGCFTPLELSPEAALSAFDVTIGNIETPLDLYPGSSDIICSITSPSVYAPFEFTPDVSFILTTVPNPEVYAPFSFTPENCNANFDTTSPSVYAPFDWSGVAEVVMDAISPFVSTPLVLYPQAVSITTDVYGECYAPFVYTPDEASVTTDILAPLFWLPVEIYPDAIDITIDTIDPQVWVPYFFWSDAAQIRLSAIDPSVYAPQEFRNLVSQIAMDVSLGEINTPLNLVMYAVDIIMRAIEPTVWNPTFCYPVHISTELDTIDPLVILGDIVRVIKRTSYLLNKLSLSPYGKDTYIGSRIVSLIIGEASIDTKVSLKSTSNDTIIKSGYIELATQTVTVLGTNITFRLYGKDTFAISRISIEHVLEALVESGIDITTLSADTKLEVKL